MVIDYCGINSQLLKNIFPLPHIDAILDEIAALVYFTTIDLAKAFNQICMMPGQEKYTAFVTPCGLFESLVMPFGNINLGAHMQGYINAVLIGIASLPHLLDKPLEKRIYCRDIVLSTLTIC